MHSRTVCFLFVVIMPLLLKSVYILHSLCPDSKNDNGVLLYRVSDYICVLMLVVSFNEHPCICFWHAMILLYFTICKNFCARIDKLCNTSKRPCFMLAEGHLAIYTRIYISLIKAHEFSTFQHLKI